MSRVIVCWVLFAASVAGAMAAPSSAIRVSAGRSGTSAEKLAISELTEYARKLFTNPIDFSADDGPFDIVLGTPGSNPRVKDAVSNGRLVLPTGKNSDQGYTVKTLADTLYVAGNTDQGMRYGLYDLLEHYGVYFQISGERLPAQSAFQIKQLDICLEPVFRYRGLLPWDNFLCGMSGYNFEHYQELIDRATRLKFNLLQFHFYPGLAFFTETWQDKPVNPTFIGSPVDVFRTRGAVGEKAFGGIDLFGAQPYVEHLGNPRAQAEASQQMMRQVIDYAHRRGFVTCVGFELMLSNGGDFTHAGLIDPLNPKNADLAVERFRCLTRTYPNSDYYWMWETEAQGYLNRSVKNPGHGEMRKKLAHWITNPDLAGDIDYAYLFREVAKRLTPAERSRLATGGWSIEHLFPGMNAEFPKEVIFASLNSYVPPSGQEQAKSYRVAKEGRRAWMIDWWEFDGGQWFPQFRAEWQESMYRRCAEYGVEGVTLLGWKLSTIEHNVRYLSEFCWHPGLTGREFYRTFVTRYYGPTAASLAELYTAYDRFEPETPCGAPVGPNMHYAPGWTAIEPVQLPSQPAGLNAANWTNRIARIPNHIAAERQFIDRDERAIRQIRSLLPGLDEQGRSFARLMINRFEARGFYLRMLIALDELQLNYDRLAREKGPDPARQAVGEYARQALDSARLMIEKYAEEIRNRGDQGVVAQVNEQVYQIVKRSLISLGVAASSYVTVDRTDFRMRPTVPYDFSGKPPWAWRDGKAGLATHAVDGRPTLKLEIGGDNTQFNSAVIHAGVIDLEQSPFLDFRIRTPATEPVAIMFQTELDTTGWRSLNLVGTQSGYAFADALTAGVINDGQWHRVTWDLAKLVSEQVAPGCSKIKNVIIGSWEKPSQPIVVEFQSFAFGRRNTPD